jgi:hypothetical protein
MTTTLSAGTDIVADLAGGLWISDRGAGRWFV